MNRPPKYWGSSLTPTYGPKYFTKPVNGLPPRSDKVIEFLTVKKVNPSFSAWRFAQRKLFGPVFGFIDQRELQGKKL
jgi:hypothetical protein